MSDAEATAHAGGAAHLIQLDPDHPGFRDPVYRARRDAIARIALSYRSGDPIPDAPYSEEEHGVWRAIQAQLGPLHQARVCREILELQQIVPLPRDRIPQLGELNRGLLARTGFRMEPVAGLVNARTFLSHLGRQVFLSTQYIRHHSRPFYTPEPDVVHELVGHAATLAHPGIAAVNAALGRATAVADDRQMRRIDRVYWFTMEFGVVCEEGALKAFGAGLLSSAGELAGYEGQAELRGWDLARIAETEFDPTDYQPVLFVAPGFDALLSDVLAWVEGGGWRG